MKKLLVFAIAILGFTAVSFAQPASATATASGTIVTPLQITRTGNLAFGNIISAASIGTVVVSTAGTASYTGGASAYAIPGTISAAKFDVIGSRDASYSISAITAITVTSGANSMNVNTFTTDPLLTAGKLSSGGLQTINVGATLNVGVTQAPGYYTSPTPFTVTINYN